jgi:hypothetical protein
MVLLVVLVYTAKIRNENMYCYRKGDKVKYVGNRGTLKLGKVYTIASNTIRQGELFIVLEGEDGDYNSEFFEGLSSFDIPTYDREQQKSPE